jgi:hypothetical protein
LNLQDLKQLIVKYNAGKASSEEIAMLEQWYDSIGGTDAKLDEAQTELIKQEIHSRITDHILIKNMKNYKDNYSPKVKSLHKLF